MKTVLKTVLKTILFGTIILLSACTKDSDETFCDNSGKEFTARTEGYTLSDTKTTLNPGRHVLWDEEDHLAVWSLAKDESGEYKVTTGGVTTATLQFLNKMGWQNKNASVSFYPYSTTLTCDEGKDVYTINGVEFPDTQLYSAGSFAHGGSPMVAVMENQRDRNFKFKNILGVLKITLKETSAEKSVVRSILFKGNNNEIIAGSAKVKAMAEGVPVVQMTGEGMSIMIDCGADGVALSDEGTDFYITLPPQTLSNGYAITVNCTDGSQFKLSDDAEIVIRRAVILSSRVMEVNETVSKSVVFSSKGNSTIALVGEGNPTFTPSMEYSFDGISWDKWNNTDSTISYKTLYLRGSGNERFGSDGTNYYSFVMGGDNATCSGNIMALLDYEGTSTTISTEYCFYKLFDNCSKLISSPELPATDLMPSCYAYMFSACTALATPPALPATELSYRCYYSMFRGCTSLTTAPVLPATKVVTECYRSMFQDCTSLTSSPDLPAMRLSPMCYAYMFNGCSKIRRVECLAIDISANECVSKWLEGVAASGTFIKDGGMADWVKDSVDGIPLGWEVKEGTIGAGDGNEEIKILNSKIRDSRLQIDDL